VNLNTHTFDWAYRTAARFISRFGASGDQKEMEEQLHFLAREFRRAVKQGERQQARKFVAFVSGKK
jgi:hypothetical protein